jgi:hypothetical protein
LEGALPSVGLDAVPFGLGLTERVNLDEIPHWKQAEA